LKEATGVKPILLLDDFFDKIDEHRVANIVSWLASNEVGQMFISDTSTGRMPEVLRSANISWQAWDVVGGKLESIR
jgi:DNA replication and repair protein RecF